MNPAHLSFGWRVAMGSFLKPRVREYWDKIDVHPPLIRNRAGGVEVVGICVRLARISRF
jgi:hypothetical protein